MHYNKVSAAKFLFRENRFVAAVLLNGEEIKVHVKNTGRCRELLQPGAEVFLSESPIMQRKYRYDLIAVKKGDLLINMDSQAPNAVFFEFLKSGKFLDGITWIKPEFTYGKSRIDFCFERGEERHLLEVKGVTLEENGICRFPDAPTERGTKHLQELIKAAENGFHAWICFIVQMEGMRWLEPNACTDPAFAAALKSAADAGVQVCAYACNVTPEDLFVSSKLPVHLCT